MLLSAAHEMRYDGGMDQVAPKDNLGLRIARRIERSGDIRDTMATVAGSAGLSEAQTAEPGGRLDTHRTAATVGALWTRWKGRSGRFAVPSCLSMCGECEDLTHA